MDILMNLDSNLENIIKNLLFRVGIYVGTFIPIHSCLNNYTKIFNIKYCRAETKCIKNTFIK